MEERRVATAVAEDQIRPPSVKRVPASVVRHHPLVAVGAVMALFYLVYLLHAFTSGHDARSFIMLERYRLLQSHKSSVIKVEPGFPYAKRGWGYDGQYFYMMALDPVNARYYVRGGSYYYSRVLYPLSARALALGRPALIPYTLILINLLSVAWGTVMLAAWLRRKRISPWFALIYGACSGIFVCFQRDLTEPLAYALLATGIYVVQFGGKRRVLLSGLCFGLALLTRDKAALLAAVYILGFLVTGEGWASGGWVSAIRRMLPATILLGVMTLLPYAALKVFLYLWMHSVAIAPGQQVAPLAAVFAPHLDTPSLLSDALTALVPGLICLVLTIWAFIRGTRDLSLVALFALVLVTTVTLSPSYFRDVVGLMRVTILVVMAALYALPTIDRVTGGNRAWLYLCAVFWLSMTPSLFITSALYPWIQILTVAVALLDMGLLVAGRRLLRTVRAA